MQPQQPQQVTWKERHMQRAEQVSDVLEVALAYGARLAEWVIIGCLLAGLFMTLPGVREVVPLLVSNGILGLQMFSLDIAGLGLLPIEKHARMSGNRSVANGARWMIGLLISITIVTSLSFTVGQILPATQVYTSKIDVALILVRVIVSIFFKLFMGTVRTAGVQAVSVQQYEDKVGELVSRFSQQVQAIATRLSQMEQAQGQHLQGVQGQVSEVATQLAHLDQSFQQQLSESSLELASALTAVRESSSQLAQSLQQQLATVRESVQHHVKVREIPHERPVLRALPPVVHDESKTTPLHEAREEALSAKTAPKFDARAFVFHCLQDNAALKLAEIQQLARAANHELSEATASRYRKLFFECRESTSVQAESSLDGSLHDNSPLQGESVAVNA